MNQERLDELLSAYEKRKEEIDARLRQFRKVRRHSFNVLFSELCFCLLTPQSKAKVCDIAVKELQKKGLLFKGGWKEIASVLSGVRFSENKAMYIVKARELFAREGGYDLRRMIRQCARAGILREWFVKNVRGLGYKEASHFLRNVGVGFDLAILDRHVLRNLLRYDVIDVVPNHMTRKRYLDTEKKMRRFSKKISINMAALDLLFWSMETGEVFK